MSGRTVSVLKIGGSVLTGAGAYRRAAEFVADRRRQRPAERILVVVSAEQGTTDALLASARDVVDEPDAATLDLLWSTGELRSAALLVLSLHAIGVAGAAAANVHQTGLARAAVDGPTALRALRLRALLSAHEVVVVPGFLARGEGDAIVSLGRGGSDLTAVLLAAGLGASTCELLKDVPGYFSADPNASRSARHLPALSYADALAMADGGCELVQRQALVSASEAGLTLVIRAIDRPQSTCVNV